MVIQFKVKEAKLSQLSASWVVSNSYNYVRAQFNFASDDWDEKGKTAVFTFNGREYPVTLDRNDSCRVPWEVLQPPQFNVYVVGGDLESEMIYTNSCPIDVHPSNSIHIYDNSYRNPTPDVYQQVVDMLAQKQDKLIAGSSIEIDETGEINISDEFIEELDAKIADGDCEGVYVPSYTPNGGILTFTLSENAADEKYEFDIKDTDNWHEIDSPEATSDFVWTKL